MSVRQQETLNKRESLDKKANHEGPVVGLALGSGSARGWSHIGVIQQLHAMGIRPRVVAGTSIGALVGAVYVSGQLDAFAEWVRKLTFRDVIGFLDVSFTGGVVKGERLFSFFSEHHQNPDIESLDMRFATVATDMRLGREVWIEKGPVLDAARASCALPGLFSPVKHNDRWMLDGGLVNPVPVSVCRALGAEMVIAVNLNGQLVGKQFSRREQENMQAAKENSSADERGLLEKVVHYFVSPDANGNHSDASPSLFDVIGASIDIMQDRITRSRMAGEPADISLVPLFEDLALMDFHRAEEAIEEGRRVVRASEERIGWMLKKLGD